MFGSKILAVILSLSLTVNLVVSIPLQLKAAQAQDLANEIQGSTELEELSKSEPRVQSRLLCLLLLKPLITSILGQGMPYFPLNIPGLNRPATAAATDGAATPAPAAGGAATPAPAGGAGAAAAPAEGEKPAAGAEAEKTE